MEVPGIWMVVGEVPLEVPSGVCVAGFPEDTETSGGLVMGPELLETTVEWFSVVCEGVGIGGRELAVLSVVEAGVDLEVAEGLGVWEDGVVIWSFP